jgi:hypothetical protein
MRVTAQQQPVCQSVCPRTAGRYLAPFLQLVRLSGRLTVVSVKEVIFSRRLFLLPLEHVERAHFGT